MPVGEANGGSGRCLGYLKHDDKSQADGQKMPVGPGVTPIVFPEGPIPAGGMALSVGSRAGAFLSFTFPSLSLYFWAWL